MALALVRSAAPLRRRFDLGREALPSVDEVVAGERPAEPVHCLRPHVLIDTASRFVGAFPGSALYAVKCNPDPRVLRALWQGGVRAFDCASPAEIHLVRTMFPEAGIHYMHPVKARPAIAEASRRYGVFDFALDSLDEMDKIVAETGESAAGNLGLIVRLQVDNTAAAYDLSGKFGADVETAARILAAARPLAARLGISFHVGSQCMDPQAYARAIRHAHQAIVRSGVTVDILDVGGGFPVAYAGVSPPPLERFIAAIEGGLQETGLAGRAHLWAEPGRALVAGGASVVTQVQLRRGRDLYINDGVYGSLYDAGPSRVPFPMRLIRPDSAGASTKHAGFRLFGPTCDSADRMEGPFALPDDAAEGDWIEVGQLGAYGACLRTAFNGFDRARLVEVRDAPLV